MVPQINLDALERLSKSAFPGAYSPTYAEDRAVLDVPESEMRFLMALRNESDGLIAEARYGRASRKVVDGHFIPHSIRFNHIVDAVEARCMAADGPVTPTLQEISEKELAALWRSVRGMRAALAELVALEALK